MDYDIRSLQVKLAYVGFSPGEIDGIMGPKTEAAIVAFKRTRGFRPRPYVGPLTWKALTRAYLSQDISQDRLILPWINEISKYMGLHEQRNKTELKAWLTSDGRALGDPSKFPWCGDAVQTAIALTLPDEPMVGVVKENPYLARNWLQFGRECGMTYGAIGVCHRGDPKSIYGHVFFVVGYDPSRNCIRARGGNQKNKVCDVWISETRMLGYRYPKTYDKTYNVPIMDSLGAVVSTNEA